VTVYPFIEAEKAGRRNVARACALLKVSRAAFYQHLAGPSERERADAGLTGQIQAVHDESKGRYGAPRIHAELRRRGRRHSRKRVARLMRAAGIRGRAPRRWRKTTIADPAAATRADRIRRDFTTDAAKINARWCGDITYIGTWEGWLYLATVIDIASRRVVGYALADHLRTELISAALINAVAARSPGPGVIFHADRGCQGGFNWSSQHLDLEVGEWGDDQAGLRQRRGGRRCGRRDGRRWRGGSTGSGSGRRSRGALRVRTLVSRPACRRRSGAGGSASVAACRLRTSGRIRAAICRSSSVRRSRSAVPTVTASGRSPGIWAVRRRRSPGSCGETPEPAAARWSTGR
jgi:HTH-like domain/Integrase core domain